MATNPFAANAQNPFAQFGYEEAPSAPQVIDGPPRQPAPQTAAQQENERLQNERLRQQIAEAERGRIEGGAGRITAEARSQAQARISAARQLRSQLQEFERLFRPFEGSTSVPELGAMIGVNATDDVSRAQAAAAGMMPLARQAFRVPGSGSDTEREAQYIEGIIPNLGTRDATTRQRIDQLYRMIEDTEREQAIILGNQAQGAGTVDDIRGAVDTARQRQPAAQPVPPAPPEGTVMFNDEARPPTPEGFSPEQASAYDAFLRANPRATADQLRAFGQSIGFEINNADEIIRARDAGAGVQRGEAAQVRQPVIDRAGATNAPIVTSLELATGINPDVAMRGAADVVSLGLADEIAATGDTIFSGGTYAENLANQRGIDRSDMQNSPGTRFAGQLAGGALIPTGVGRTAFGAARSSLRAGAGREAARAAAREAGARRLGLEGAAFGGAYGAGSSEGSFTERLSQGGVSALIGGGAGYGLGRGVGAAVDRYGRGGESPRYRNALEAYEARTAAERQGIDLMPADVGGPMTRRLTAGASQSPVSAGTIIRGAQRTREQGGDRLGELAREAGAPQRQEVLGDTAIRAANDYVESSGTAGREMYREARELSQDVMANAPRAFRNLNAQLRELGATREVEGPLIDGLSRFRSVIADESGLKPLDIDAIRRLRTAVATEARTEGLRGTDYQRRAGQVLDDLREDITSQLSPEAARAFRRADDAWRERLTTIDGVLNNVLGRDRSAEGVARGLSNMAVGDSSRLGSFLRAIPVDDARIIRGSLIQDLGRATPGQQNAAGDVFSFDTFLTNWNRLPERTRATLFPGGSRRDIEDLARVAEAVKETGKYANRSNTGSTVIGGALGAGSVMQPWIIPAIGLNYVTGRLLSSPVMVRWLAREPANPAQARVQIQQLGKIARTQPAISSEVLGLQQALLRQFEGAARSPATRAAADEDQNIRGE